MEIMIQPNEQVAYVNASVDSSPIYLGCGIDGCGFDGCGINI